MDDDAPDPAVGRRRKIGVVWLGVTVLFGLLFSGLLYFATRNATLGPAAAP